jgi:hypothetical protein
MDVTLPFARRGAKVSGRRLRAAVSVRRRRSLPSRSRDFGVSISTLPSVFKELDYRPIAPRRGVPILFREPLGRPGPPSRPSAGGGRDDADPEGAPALPNRRPKPLWASLTGGGDTGIAKPFALSQIDHMRSIANQLYALLHPRPTLRWQPGNAACREARGEGPR